MINSIKKIIDKKFIFVFIIFFFIITFPFLTLSENKFKTQATIRLPNIYFYYFKPGNINVSISLDRMIYDIEIDKLDFIKTLEIKIEEKFNIPKKCISIQKFNQNTFVYSKPYVFLGLSSGYKSGYNLFVDPKSNYLLMNIF